MAITIENEPQEYTPAYNQMIFVASSTNTAEDNFQYIFDIWYDGAFRSRHKIPANPDNGYGQFDARKKIESLLSWDIDGSTTDFDNNTQSFKKYYVRVGEEYDVSGVRTEFPNLTDSSDIYAINAALEKLDFVDWDDDDYVLATSDDKFLTNMPDAQNIELNQLGWLYSVNDTPANYDHLRVRTYDASGVLQSTDDISNSLTASTDNNQFIRVGVGTQNIVDALADTSYFDGIAYYTVVAQTGANADISETRRFNIVTQRLYTTYRVHFLNVLGGFDPFNFTLVTRKTTQSKRTSFKRNPNSWNGTAYSYDKSSQSDFTKLVASNDQLLLRSDYLTDAQITWLKEMVTSPVVLLESGTDLIPMIVETNVFEEFEKESTRLFRQDITLRYGHTNYRQRG